MDLTYPQCSEAGSCKPKKIETDPSALIVRKANLGKVGPLNSDITVSIVKEKFTYPLLWRQEHIVDRITRVGKASSKSWDFEDFEKT